MKKSGWLWMDSNNITTSGHSCHGHLRRRVSFVWCLFSEFKWCHTGSLTSYPWSSSVDFVCSSFYSKTIWLLLNIKYRIREIDAPYCIQTSIVYFLNDIRESIYHRYGQCFANSLYESRKTNLVGRVQVLWS